ncbi:MAG: hypothetical protein IT381_28015 [Deltaproteobacteria bacterium]|nr:hypothetical protein [Deltaproteobacteria bacterium]
MKRRLEPYLMLALLLIAHCTEPATRRSTVAEPECPSVDFRQELHAATFHFEHGVLADGRAALARARDLSGGSADAISTGLLTRLAVIERAIDSDPARARGELELLRADFRDWACLPEPLHRQFHALLPRGF